MKYLVGDCIGAAIKDSSNAGLIIIPHVVNNINSFGSGFARAMMLRLPKVKQVYHAVPQGRTLGNVTAISFTEGEAQGVVVINMCAQNGTISQSNPKPIRYDALETCMKKVELSIAQFESTHLVDRSREFVKIYCPKFGAGLAGGDWNIISGLIDKHWSKIDVTVFTLD